MNRAMPVSIKRHHNVAVHVTVLCVTSAVSAMASVAVAPPVVIGH